jgi:starch-binding outer membrane protein, SusD/RagB family
MGYRDGRRTRGTAARVLTVLAVAVTMGACGALDRLLSVDVPEYVDDGDMNRPEVAHLLVSGTIADFENALGTYILHGGILGNELRDATNTQARYSLDRRDIDDTDPYGRNSATTNPPGLYVPLSTAIWTANNALNLLQGWTDAQVAKRADLIAQSAAFAGYSTLLMGEGFCTAVVEESGPERTKTEVFQRADARFTEAITAANTAGNADIRNMALIGRARTRLNLGNREGAAADARAALSHSPQYEKFATASSEATRRYNKVGNEFSLRRITVDPTYRGLTVGGAVDPRVRVIDTGRNGIDATVRVFIAAKFGEALDPVMRNLPIPIATWREAHLIIAEAEGGQEAVNRINVLRNHWNLPLYEGGTAEQIRQQVIQERARELFLEGQHLNDLQRFDIPSTPATGTAYRRGGFYGDVRCFPLPALEKNNNPNFR